MVPKLRSDSKRSSLRSMTPKEKKILEYIESYMGRHGVAPSYQEMKDHFGFASYNSIQRYLKQLETKGYVEMAWGNQKRAITLLHSSSSLCASLDQMQERDRRMGQVLKANKKEKEAPQLLPSPVESFSLPLLGRVAAGRPIEAMEYDEFVDVPPALVRNASKTFALRVQGESMIEDGILDGDVILVQSQPYANNGEIVVAVVENEATVKRFFSMQSMVELRPANNSMKPLKYLADQVDIRGIVVGLMRKF